MKRMVGLVGFLLFTVLILSIHNVNAQQDDERSSHIAQGYEIRYSEKKVAHPDITKLKSSNYSLRPYCTAINTVEYGNNIPYPTTTVPLKGHFFIFQGKANWLPNDPGQAGKLGYFGVDSDRDCVRDDIERLIARLLSGANQKKARKYLFEYAKWRIEFLQDHSFKDPQPFDERLKDISRNIYKSSECFRRQVGDKKSKEIIDIIFSKIHDTFPRSYQYIHNNAIIGGWTTREKIPVTCP